MTATPSETSSPTETATESATLTASPSPSPGSSGPLSVLIKIFDSAGRQVVILGPVGANNVGPIAFSAQPFHVLQGLLTITSGTVLMTWDGKGSFGQALATGDYQVRVVASEAGQTDQVYNASLTLILEADRVLSSAWVGPMPAKEKMTFDLSGVAGGHRVRVQVWNVAGDLVFSQRSLSGPIGIFDWDLRSPSGQPVAGGIYLILFALEEQVGQYTEKRWIKGAIQR